MNAKLSVRVIVVADIDESVHFYRDTFGFACTELFEGGGAELSAVTQLDDVRLRAQMMRDAAGVTIELVQFLRPYRSWPRETPKLNHYGYTHLAFAVDDLDGARARAIAAGGRTLDDTRIATDLDGLRFQAMYVTDPNGVRVELLQIDGVPAQYLWNGICVRDLERSINFYRSFGFEPGECFDHSAGPEWVGRLNQIPGLRLKGQVIRDPDGAALELIRVYGPEPPVEKVPRDYTRHGLANLAYFVDDRDTVAELLRAGGGTMFDTTRVGFSSMKQWHGIDPDGARIELVQHLSGS